jgi:iron(III) transport system permease protein
MLAMAVCVTPITLGFLIPVLTLLAYAVEDLSIITSDSFSKLVLNSMSLAVTAGIGVTLIAWVLASAKRLYPSPLNNSLIRISTIGYALPGILLAVALLKPVGILDHWLTQSWSDGPTVLLSGSVFMLLYAYACRFLTVAFQSIESGFAGISNDIDAAAKTLGATTRSLIWRIHFPLLKPSVLAACLLVFVDVMRELPATLILRPFNFNTLATQVYRLASDERLAEASSAAIFIVLLGVLPVIFLQRSESSRTPVAN